MDTREASCEETSMADSAIINGMMPMIIWTAAMFSLGNAAATEATMGTGTNMPIMHMAAA